jgi:hypothetical protein
MNVGGVVDSPGKRCRTIIIVSIIIAIALTSAYFVSQYHTVRRVKVRDGKTRAIKRQWAKTSKSVGVSPLLPSSESFRSGDPTWRF